MSKSDSTSNESFKSKEQLYALFYELTSEVKGKEIELDEEEYIDNIKTIKLSQLISYLRDTIQILIKKQVDEAKTEKRKNQEDLYGSDINKIEKTLRNHEANERRLIQRFYKQRTHKEALENKIEEYIDMEEEFEEMKASLKYEDGKFLENDRKDNEIIIVRAENTNLKVAISDLEKKNKNYIQEMTEKDKLIEQLTDSVEEMKVKLERTQKELSLFSSVNMNNNNTGSVNHNGSNNNNQSKCNCCGCYSSNKSPDKTTFEQTQLKLFNNKKKSQKQANMGHYNLNSVSGSLSNSLVNFDVFANKVSASTSKNKNNNQQNNSMNMMLEKTKGDIINKYIIQNNILNSTNALKSNCIKITRLPVNQGNCPIINNNNLSSKRDQSSAKILLSKKPSSQVNSKSLLSSSLSKGEIIN